MPTRRTNRYVSFTNTFLIPTGTGQVFHTRWRLAITVTAALHSCQGCLAHRSAATPAGDRKTCRRRAGAGRSAPQSRGARRVTYAVLIALVELVARLFVAENGYLWPDHEATGCRSTH
jgi:hypothetical protein